MPAIGRNTKRAQLNELTDAAIQARWAALIPTFVKWAIFASFVSVVLFSYNHFAHPVQRVTDFVQVGFQITSIFAVCFVFLTGAAFFFRSNLWIKKK